MDTAARKHVHTVALVLAQDNKRAEPGITKVLWFPHDLEVRLVEIEDNLPASATGQVEPFYFDASPVDGVSAPSGIALIRPSEEGKLRLPDGWGDWASAVELTLTPGNMEVAE